MACVWWASVIPQFNDTPVLVLCLEVKAVRHASRNHGGAFFRAGRDGLWVPMNAQTSNRRRPHGAKTEKRESVNKLFGIAVTQTARMCSDEIIRWCQISQAHEKTSFRVRKRRLQHFQAGLHQGIGIYTFLFEKKNTSQITDSKSFAHTGKKNPLT